MSIAAAKAELRTILLGIAAPRLAKCYDKPKEATSLGEFPVAILALAPAMAHTISEETAGSFGLARHDYAIRCYLFVGTRQTPIGELTDRCEAWVEPILAALANNLTLNGVVNHIGNGVDQLATYMEGPIAWGLQTDEPAFYGLRIDIPVTELISTPMEP